MLFLGVWLLPILELRLGGEVGVDHLLRGDQEVVELCRPFDFDFTLATLPTIAACDIDQIPLSFDLYGIPDMGTVADTLSCHFDV
jgi:hypothetical protein